MNVMASYDVSKSALDELKTVSDSASSLVGFRKLVSASDRALKAKKNRIADTTKELLQTYTQQAAAPQIQEMQASYEKDTKLIKERLQAKLDSILQAKREVLTDFIIASPSNEQLNMLQTLQLRNLKNVGETEWGLLVSKLSTNHQAAQILAEMAKKAGKDFVPAFNPEDELETIEQFRDRADRAIAEVGDLDNSAINLEWINDYDNSWIIETAEKLDSQVFTAIPDPSISLQGRLKAARETAMKAGDWETYNKIHSFIIDNVAAFETEKEREKNLREQAEYLIEMGMQAKEKKATPATYEEHRNQLLDRMEKAEGENK